MSAGKDLGVEVRGRVLTYTPNALMDDFAGRGHQAFDATTIEILGPSRLKHRRLTIYHDEPVAEFSPWRAVGSTLSFAIDEDLLNEGAQAFTASARNLRVEQPPGMSGV